MQRFISIGINQAQYTDLVWFSLDQTTEIQSKTSLWNIPIPLEIGLC